MAMLTVLETLEPTERAVLVLHQVFDMPYGEIAESATAPIGGRSSTKNFSCAANLSGSKAKAAVLSPGEYSHGSVASHRPRGVHR